MKVLISGVTGTMGRILQQKIHQQNDMEVVAGFARKEDHSFSFPVTNDLSKTPACDVLIDFSSQNALEPLLTFAVDRRLPLVLAATGYDSEQEKRIEECASLIPIFKSGNLSTGIYWMQVIARILSEALSDYDIELIEKHHRDKKDAPSGTAKLLFDAVNEGRSHELLRISDRSDRRCPRDKKEVGISSLRGGSFVGEHSLLFCGDDEILELKHTAMSKSIFADGAIRAAQFIVHQEQGLFTLKDLYEIERSSF